MNESDVAKRVLKSIAPTISQEHDKFGGWLAAGSGAGLALLIGQSDKLLQNIVQENFLAAAMLILFSLCIYAWQRWIASQVVASLASRAAIEEIQSQHGPLTLNTSMLIEQMASRSIWPFSWVMRRAGSKGAEHETHLTHMTQRQTLATLLQTALIFGALAALLCGIRMADAGKVSETVGYLISAKGITHVG